MSRFITVISLPSFAKNRSTGDHCLQCMSLSPSSPCLSFARSRFSHLCVGVRSLIFGFHLTKRNGDDGGDALLLFRTTTTTTTTSPPLLLHTSYCVLVNCCVRSETTDCLCLCASRFQMYMWIVEALCGMQCRMFAV